MSQVTIHLEEDTLAAVKAAAARTQMSGSKWFAQFAEAEKEEPMQSWDDFFAEIDSLGDPNLAASDGWDALLQDRYSGLGATYQGNRFEVPSNTDTLIYVFKRAGNCLTWLDQRNDSDVAISTIYLFELEYGMGKSDNRIKMDSYVLSLCRRYAVLDVDRAASQPACRQVPSVRCRIPAAHPQATMTCRLQALHCQNG